MSLSYHRVFPHWITPPLRTSKPATVPSWTDRLTTCAISKKIFGVWVDVTQRACWVWGERKARQIELCVLGDIQWATCEWLQTDQQKETVSKSEKWERFLTDFFPRWPHLNLPLQPWVLHLPLNVSPILSAPPTPHAPYAGVALARARRLGFPAADSGPVALWEETAGG